MIHSTSDHYLLRLLVVGSDNLQVMRILFLLVEIVGGHFEHGQAVVRC